MRAFLLFIQLILSTAALGLSSCTTLAVIGMNQSSGVELQSDFDQADWLKTFEPKQSVPWRQGEDRTHIVFDTDRHHKVVQISYPKGAVGPYDGGAQWISYLPHPSDQMTVSYWIRFAPDFDWMLGGKLPGLIGGKDEKSGWPITGGIHPTGSNGWSARIMWRQNGEIIQYVYHMNQPGKYGDELKWKKAGKPAHFERGVWQEVTTEVTLNEPGKRNGRIRSWLGNQLALDQADLEFRSNHSIQIDALLISTFFGGEDPDWAPPKAESLRMDDFKVIQGAN